MAIKITDCLDYDELRVLNGLKNKAKTGATVSGSYITKRLEAGIGVHLYDSDLNKVSNSDEATYMILDTGIPSKENEKENLCFGVYKNDSGSWIGGATGTLAEIIENTRESDGEADIRYEVCAPDKDSSFVDVIRPQLNGVALAISKMLAKDGRDWSVGSIREALVSTVWLACRILKRNYNWHGYKVKQIAGDWITVRPKKKKAMFNTGFLNDRGDPIIMIADADVRKKIPLSCFRLAGGMKQLKVDFGTTSTPRLSMCVEQDDNYGKLWDREINTHERARMWHCLVGRAYRRKIPDNELTFNQLWDRVLLSIEMCKRLEAGGLKVSETAFDTTQNCFCYLLPFYMSSNPVLSEPDAIMFICRGCDNDWVIPTFLDVRTGLKDAIAIDKYPKSVWAKNRPISEILEAEYRISSLK